MENSCWNRVRIDNLLLSHQTSKIKLFCTKKALISFAPVFCLVHYRASHTDDGKKNPNDLYYVKGVVGFYICTKKNLVRPLHHKMLMCKMRNICSFQDDLSFKIDKDLWVSCLKCVRCCMIYVLPKHAMFLNPKKVKSLVKTETVWESRGKRNKLLTHLWECLKILYMIPVSGCSNTKPNSLALIATTHARVSLEFSSSTRKDCFVYFFLSVSSFVHVFSYIAKKQKP